MEANYEQKIMDKLQGNTPKEKYEYLKSLTKKVDKNDKFLLALNYRVIEHLQR